MPNNKVAVVTGASRGIGRAIALQLSEEGYCIVVNYNKSEAGAQQVVDEITQAGGSAICVQADVSRFEEAQALLEATMKQYGRVDVLVNNAGITKDGILARMKAEDFQAVIDANLTSAFNCSRHAAQIMMKQREGCIINITSVSGIVGNAGQANYSASKAGMIGLTKSMARELVGRNIRCNAVAPGMIQSSMTEQLSDEVMAKLTESIPQKRLGTGKDVACAVAFLASEKASYITGQVLAVDGGMSM
ncbi:3-oxoacyl-[acyl-carrier-protein] reductase [Clostridia bacterium OttesenSCG-928-F22]|nr:3-oxoacyl-[acyl-carrier-protein] reductase [Clostridia bacterium OttesenSCG-928-F22]